MEGKGKNNNITNGRRGIHENMKCEIVRKGEGDNIVYGDEGVEIINERSHKFVEKLKEIIPVHVIHIT